MLTDYQVKAMAKKMGIPLAGVVFKTELPKMKLEYNKTYIINLEDETDENGEPNEGTHYVFLQMNKSPHGNFAPLYFDSYGKIYPTVIETTVRHYCDMKCPYTTKDIQSIVSGMCGWYCLALSFYLNRFPQRTHNIYDDVGCFLGFFNDLNVSNDHKQNEWVLSQFFQPKEGPKREYNFGVTQVVKQDIKEIEEAKEEHGNGII
jgi:hypothetical protein